MAARKKTKRNATPRRLRNLFTVKDVVAKLGGVNGVEQLTNCRNRTSIFNWVTANEFPSRYYKLMLDALRRKGCTAPAVLWGQEGQHKIAA